MIVSPTITTTTAMPTKTPDYRTYFEHLRYRDDDEVALPRGGHTLAWRIDEASVKDGDPKVVVGIALCCPQDNYNRKIGGRSVCCSPSR